MKIKLFIVVASLCVCAEIAHAQGCLSGVSYAEYDSQSMANIVIPSSYGTDIVPLSSSGSVVGSTSTTITGHILTSVLMDGSASMNLSTCPYADSATHTPSVYNVVNGVGGWMSGPASCPSCYLSLENDEDSGAIPVDTEFAWNSGSNVRCSIAGIFWSRAFPHKVKISKLNFILENWDASNCYYMLWCPNGNTSATCPYTTFTAYGGNNPTTRCTRHNYAWEFFLVTDGNCWSVGISFLATGPINCS